MKKAIILIGVALTAVTGLFAQNEVDALRYSYLIPGGSARYNAMGGSFGALGGDASVAIFNPAGLGVLRSSDFSISPTFAITNSEASLLGKTSTDYDVNFNLNNLAYVGSIPINQENGISNLNVGVTYNRMNNFHQNTLIRGNNDYNSMTDWFAEHGSGLTYDNLADSDNFYSNLAWESYLIDLDPTDLDSASYISAFYGDYGQEQNESIYKSGHQGEYNFSVSTNFMHKLFVGASVGIQSVKYEEVRTHEEIDTDDVIADFNSFTYKEYLETNGSGVNFKLGILYSPVPWMRFGGAIHTPTFFDLRDSYRTTIASSFVDANKSQSIESLNGSFDYELTTPFKANASLGFIVKQQALINIDYEYVDYTMAKLRSYDYGFFDENDNIRSEYKAGHNVKVGMEYRYGPFAFRAGGAYYDSPYASNHINKDAYTLVYSGGLGVRSDNVYFDVAYSFISNSNYYYMYESANVVSPATEILKNQSRIVTTIGFRF